MQIYFDKDRMEKVGCRDGKERHVGGMLIPPNVWPIVQSMEVNWDTLPEESDPYDLTVGNVVGVYLTEIGPSPAPYIVSDVEEDPDGERMDRIIVLHNSNYEDVEKIGVSCSLRGVKADYQHEETSRYISGDKITMCLLPDLQLAEELDVSEIKSYITSISI